MSSYSVESRHSHHWVAHGASFSASRILLHFNKEGGERCGGWPQQQKGIKQAQIRVYDEVELKTVGMYFSSLQTMVRSVSLSLRGVSRTTGDEARQPADFNRVAAMYAVAVAAAAGSLFHRVLAHSPWGAVSAHIVGGCASVLDGERGVCRVGCSSDRGRPHGPLW